MSFFSSLQQYVTNGVAGLGLSSRRLSLTRLDSSVTPNTVGPNPSQPSFQQSQSTSNEKPNVSTHGFPKVIPAVNTTAYQGSQPQSTLGRPSTKSSEFHSTSKSGSFRQKNVSVSPTVSERVSFLSQRKQFSPEVEVKPSSGVQESDGSYFESFSALSWKRENRRLSAVRAAENRAETIPEHSRDVMLQSNYDNPYQKEHLYATVLYAITNTIGAPSVGGQFTQYKEDAFLYAQRCFNVTPERHYRILDTIAERRPNYIILTVIIYEAEGLEAKDVNGFSNPYCMLGIQPNQPIGLPLSPQPHTMTPRAFSHDAKLDSFSLDIPEHGKLRKNHSFKLSFKRKDSRREHRDNIGALPAKYIYATSVQPQTLCPKWNEKFKCEIDDLGTEIFHLDIWDYDDDIPMREIVSKLNEGRYFKQICQSARMGCQDDFLGSVNVQICDIPSTGLEGWFKLESQGQRQVNQGRIRLKMWLSAHDNIYSPEDDDIVKIQRYEQLQRVFMLHEVLKHEPTWTWPGELSGAALTITNQIAMQDDISDLQTAIARFIAAAKLNENTSIDPKFIHRLLQQLDRFWIHSSNQLPHEIEAQLAETMNEFVQKSLEQIRRHRDIFPSMHAPSLTRLEFLLRSLGFLGSMRAFRKVSPFSRGIRGEIVAFLRKGSIDWAQSQLREAQRTSNPIAHFITTLTADIQLGLTYYHSLFDTTNGIQYFAIIYKQFDAIITDEVMSRIEKDQIPGLCITNHWTVLEGDREVPETRPFEVYFALQEFSNYKQHLSVMPQPPEKPLGLQNFYLWFEAALQRWLVVSKSKALQRVKTAIQLDQINDENARHSSSSIDVASCLYQFCDFWRQLNWPDLSTGKNYELQVCEAICAAAIEYTDNLVMSITERGHFDKPNSTRSSHELCVAANNIEHVRKVISDFQTENQTLSMSSDKVIQMALINMEQNSEKCLYKINHTMQAPLHKAVFHLAWSPDSLPANQAIIPLFEYLDVHLAVLNKSLHSKNFNTALKLIWIAVLNELAVQMDTGNDSERPTNFHERLYEALGLLVGFFHADGLGLPIESLHCENYWRIEHRLQYHKLDTDRLIDMFYIHRLQEQCSLTGPTNYGVLTVRAYFNHDSLCVEILSAKDIIPLDNNGFSDPFVIIELLPRRIFSHCFEQQTNVCKKTLNPIFDECFEFSVSREQCQHEAAMIIFTVMDHDVLTSNDFAGETFLGLNNIPGVAEFTTSVENLHGLKHIELPLMHQKDKCNPILQILESRTNEKQALDFVRKQKARITS